MAASSPEVDGFIFVVQLIAAIDKELMEVDVQVQTSTESLDQRDGS